MGVYQIDTEKQHLAPEGGHNYAWTNVYLVEAFDDSQAQAHMLSIIAIEASVLPIDTSIRFACWRPGVGGPVPAGVQLIGQSGLLSAGTSYRAFYDTTRIVGRSDGRIVWYKRWRGPFRDVDVTGDLLTADYAELLASSYVAALMAEIPLLTRSGRSIDHVIIDPRVAMWQRRDGSERNIRSVLAG